MKLFYIANIRLPTEKAHGIQIMEMCAAFSDQGIDVELIVPHRKNTILVDPFEYHDTRRVFSIHTLPSIDFVRLGRIGYWATLVVFVVSAVGYLLFKKDAIFYSRDELFVLIFRYLGKNVIWEGHTGQKNLIARLAVHSRVPTVVITEGLRELYLSLGAHTANIFVAPDGADLGRFNIDMSQETARKELGLPLDKKIALYKGHLYEWKGAHTLARAAQHLRPHGVICVFIGGTDADVASFRNEFGHEKNVLILGNKPRQETPIYQKAADLLVIPNSAKDDVSKLYTSPMKLFGYMASGVPIIASDLPSLREIIDERLAYFFMPDDPKSLADTIVSALKDYPEAKKKGAAALLLAENYSWQKRAQNILDFINQQKLS